MEAPSPQAHRQAACLILLSPKVVSLRAVGADGQQTAVPCAFEKKAVAVNGSNSNSSSNSKSSTNSKNSSHRTTRNTCKSSRDGNAISNNSDSSDNSDN